MVRAKLSNVVLGALFSLSVFLYGCGSGGGGGGGVGAAANVIGGGGVKGPLANAIVTVYAFDAAAPGFKGAVVDTGATDASAGIAGVTLPLPLDPPYIMEFTSGPGTVDITTGAAPVITTMRTVITQSLLDSGKQIYATPLTTMAVDLAVKNADSTSLPWGGNGDTSVTEAEFLNALSVAKAQVTSTLGFGLSGSVDIFETAPLVDNDTDSASVQATAEYRAAVEALTAVVYQMDQQATGTTPDAVLTELINDLADGLIDGITDTGASTILTQAALEVLDQEPDQLLIPGTTLTVGDVKTILSNETGTTGTTSTADPATATVVTQPAETNPDRDADGVANADDAFPDDPAESVDTDGDGIGNNADMDDDNDGVADGNDDFPLDASEYTDTDNDSIGNNADEDDDGDTVPDVEDDFPLDAGKSSATDLDNDGWETDQDPDDGDDTNPGIAFVDTDGDGQADSGGLAPDSDDDGDGVLDVDDIFPLNATESADLDNDMIGDNADTDIDGDDVPNTSDAFPRNPAESVDTDGDGIGDNADTDDDNDGVSDADEGINNTNPLLRDTDGDGRLDKTDAFPLDDTEWLDTDSDTIGNNTDGDDDGDGLDDADEATAGTKPLVADTDGDGILDGTEVSSGTNPLSSDSDGDGDLDNADNCPLMANADQADTNGNGKGDVCEGAPTALDDTAATDEDVAVTTDNVLANDTDPESDTLSVADADTVSANGGTVVNNNDGTFTYTPPANQGGTDTFNYMVTDGTTGVTDSGTVTVTINPVNDAPSAVNDTAGARPGELISIPVLSNDDDIDGDTLGLSAISVVSGTSGGSAVINGMAVAYTAGVSEGTDTLTYTITDGDLTATADITITVVANQSPTAMVDSATTDEDVAVTTVNVLTNDTDPEDDSISLVGADTASANGGTVANNNDGTFTYTPAPNFNGSDSFTYTITDGNTNAAGTVTITVNAVNDAPAAADDTASAFAGSSPVVIDVLDNDSDIDDGDTRTVTVVGSVSGTSGGSVVISNSGSDVTYTPGSNAGTDTFSYTISDGVEIATAMVTVTVNDPANASGVWRISTTVTNIVEQITDGCGDSVGETDAFYVTILQTGTSLNMWTQSGISLTGSVDTGTGVATLSGTEAATVPDLFQPANDTATVNVSQSINVNAMLDTATTMSGSIVINETYDSTPICDVTLSLSADFIYRHTGSENYDGNYAIEFQEEIESSNDFGFGIQFDSDSGIEPWYAQLDFGANSLTLYDAEGTTLSASAVSYNPDTGYFEIDITNSEKEDEDGDTVIDRSGTWTDRLTGIALRDPALSDGTNGAPLLALTISGYGRGYSGDFEAGGIAQQAEVFWGEGYAKRVSPQGYTRTNTFTGGKKQTVTRIMMGLFNPPMKRTNDDARLYIQVLDGGTELCSVAFDNENVETDIAGGFVEQARQPHPDLALEEFRPGSYARAVCDASDVGNNTIFDGNAYTVRVVDSGADGMADGADDTVVYTGSVTAEVSTSPYAGGIERADLRFNGAHASYTQSGTVIPVNGFFDPGESVSVTWPVHPEGALNYMLRGNEAYDFIEHQVVTIGTSTTIGPDVLEEWDAFWFRLSAAMDDTSGARAQAFSSRLAIQGGVRGLFNIELAGSSIGLDNATFQVHLEGNSGGVMCSMPAGFWLLDCIGGMLDYSNNTVTLTMSDTEGSYTGTPGNNFDLVMHFSDAANAEVTSPAGVAGIPSTTGSGTTAARLAYSEIYVRSFRMSHNAQQRTRFNINNAPVDKYTRAVLLRDDGAELIAGSGTSYILWNDASPGNSYLDLASEHTVVPIGDGAAQRSKHFLTANTRDIAGSNFLMDPGLYKLVLIDDSGTNPNMVFHYDYTKPDAADWIAPSEDTMTINGTACSTAVCNDPVNALDVSGNPQVNLSWSIDPGVPAGAYWRIIFRDNEAVDPTKGQVRTSYMQNGDYGLAISGSTATWTNPGDIVLPTGTYQIVLVVQDDTPASNSTVLGVTTRSSTATGEAHDRLFVTVPTP